MGKLRKKQRLTAVSAVLTAGVLCAAAFCYFQPFDSYLLNSWESELSTIDDKDVEVRLEQIAALGERSLPTLVDALHSDRQLVAATAAAVLRRELSQLELLSMDESSRIVADLARDLAARSDRPGPYSAPASTQLATRLLLWPINRKLIDGERLVADCELIIRSTKRSPRGAAAEQTDEDVDAPGGSATRENEHLAATKLTPVAGGRLPVQLMDAPPLPPQNTRVLTQSPAAPNAEPPRFITVKTPRDFDTLPNLETVEAVKQPPTQPLAAGSGKSFGLRREIAPVPSGAAPRPNLHAMEDLELMRTLAGDDQSLAREAVSELYRRGFQTKHFRLAELLVDPDLNVRLELVRRLPQMSGIDSRPWLLWLSRDPDPAVRKAAVTVIATSSDSALQQRVRELANEETDDEVLRVVRQNLNTRQTSTIR